MAVDKTEDPERKLAEAQGLVDRLDGGDGVVVLTDMYGGTPSNIASRLIRPGRVEAVAGPVCRCWCARCATAASRWRSSSARRSPAVWKACFI
ncbi:Uncharacterised protein [Chromobacterium violaceum]|uniref:PTS EIIA type-4 domain-containing protein n=1 Tax=Chromobacterium violaceum TaxID=536 RepID=A0A3S4IXC8_CHRVL|nr:Uncharacterised protein [Chromobacterium violaceum]